MREDIQVLRGIAIFLVFCFHLLPQIFVNGFLGVDIFFVISGFLMAKNLTTHRITSVSDVFQFYYRRFKRILPLYFLVILLSVVIVHLFLMESLLPINRKYSIASLFLATNQLVIHESQDYFREFSLDSSSRNVFLHMWSLSVEMQFYLLVPFIFFTLQFLRNKSQRVISVITLSLASFIPFLLINPQVSFNFMPLRLWQFAAGFLAVQWTDKGVDKSDKKPEEITIICLVTISLSVVPYTINVMVLRPLVTFATAVLIAVENRENTFLQSASLSYLGNISYSVYLTHWPILCLFNENTPSSYIFCIVITLLSSILIHHCFEKPYLKLDKKSIILLVVLLASGNALLQYSTRNHKFWIRKIPQEIKELIDKNTKFFETRWQNHPFEDKCTSDKSLSIDPLIRKNVLGNCFINGTGSLSISVIGNSYSLNLGQGIMEPFQQNFSSFRCLSVIGSTGLYSYDKISKTGLELMKRHVEVYKPDVLFIVSRNTGIMSQPIVPNDKLIQQLKENIKFYEKFVGKIYILGSHPLYPRNFLHNFLQTLAQNMDRLESLHMDKRVADNFLRHTTYRMKQIQCSKCHLFDLSHVFVENGKYLTFDREELVGYVDSSIHFTPPGVQKMKPAFEKLKDEILGNL